MKKIGIIITTIIIIFTIILLAIILLNAYVINSTKKKILTQSEIQKKAETEKYDCAIVFGAGVYGTTPSDMLKDRLNTCIELYNAKVINKIIMSGDRGKKYYDEVTVMKNYAISKGIPSEDIFMDHAGFSTYETMYRAKEVFNVRKAILVTQEYHLYRALYIGKQLGIESCGVSATKHRYVGDLNRELREILARNKDIFQCIFKVKAKYLGEKISLTQSGDITNDNKK